MAVTPEYKPEFAWYFRLNDPRKLQVIFCDHGNAIDYETIPKTKYALARRIARAQQDILDRVNIVRHAVNPNLPPIILGKETEAVGPHLKLVT